MSPFNFEFELQKARIRFKILVKAIEIELRRIEHLEYQSEQNNGGIALEKTP